MITGSSHAVARGERQGCCSRRRIVNVLPGKWPRAMLRCREVIAGLGEAYTEGLEEIDVAGKVLIPGLIDAHMHIESTLLLPAELARAAVPHGTTAVIADPHEIANVLGAAGVEFMFAAASGLPLDYFFTVPSCVPPP